VKVLAAAAPQGTLQPLVYPTTQLLLGAARLVPTPRYFPIRLRLVRALNRLAQVCDTLTVWGGCAGFVEPLLNRCGPEICMLLLTLS
jgi:hypothetical protein